MVSVDVDVGVGADGACDVRRSYGYLGTYPFWIEEEVPGLRMDSPRGHEVPGPRWARVTPVGASGLA